METLYYVDRNFNNRMAHSTGDWRAFQSNHYKDYSKAFNKKTTVENKTGRMHNITQDYRKTHELHMQISNQSLHKL